MVQQLKVFSTEPQGSHDGRAECQVVPYPLHAHTYLQIKFF